MKKPEVENIVTLSLPIAALLLLIHPTCFTHRFNCKDRQAALFLNFSYTGTGSSLMQLQVALFTFMFLRLGLRGILIANDLILTQFFFIS
jgi:hypothetical protein